MLCSTIERLRARIYKFRDQLVEIMFGVDFFTPVLHDDLDVTETDSLERATFYLPTSTTWLEYIIAESTKTGKAFDRFVDIGSGKGRACFYATKSRFFKEIIGVEFSHKLLEIARSNAQILRIDEIVEFLHADARSFILPDGANLVFINNPFDAEILYQFLLHNINSFKRQGSYIGYATDLHRNTLIKFGFETVCRNQQFNTSVYRYPSPAHF